MPKNGGIGAATNAGIDMCQGQWVGFMDHDDLLVEVAIDCMIEAAERSRASVLYSDEDKIDKFGMLSAPAFKPDWNYRLLLGVNYVCHFLMVKKDLINRIGKIDSTYDGAQDHDFLLRISEAVNRDQICHVPEILYHWRITDNSTASDISTKPYAIDAGIACVSDHLKRRGKKALVKNFKQSTLYKIEWQIPTTPRIDIIIPFKDNIETTRMCIDTILEMTQYSNFCITLVDNWSTSEYLDDFIDNMNAFENIRVIRIEETFNYSRINNIAVSKSNAEMLVFMNNDVFVKDRMWLRTLVNEALADPDVGIVGGKFLYPNGSIQHGGVVLGIGGVAGHIHVGHRADDAGYGGRGYFAQELSAVTAACMLVKADVFKEVGGFDEVKLSVAFNDIDLCLKVRSAGYKVIWTPDFVADHHESLSRGSDDRPETRERFFHETQTMVERWGDLLKRDPFYSRHFDLDGRPFYDLVDPEKSQCQPDPI
jgi:GT2 family glycosyltransferase